MTLSSLSRQFRRSLFAYLRKVTRRRDPAIDRLERELKRRRAAHRPTRAILTEARALRLAQLRHEVQHG